MRANNEVPEYLHDGNAFDGSFRLKLKTFWALALFLAAGLIQSLLPPLQSPDEFAHLVRAYSLFSGDFVLARPADQPYAGAMVDRGLVEYFRVFQAIPYNTENRLSSIELRAGEQVRWQGVAAFSPAPGAAYNMPLIYLPQAAGLWLGKCGDLSVDDSYRLARFLTLLVSVGLVAAALHYFPLNPLLAGLIFMPMSLFQWASPSLDGIVFALTMLATALFLYLMKERAGSSDGTLLLLGICLLLLATCRIHLLPMLLMLAMLAVARRSRSVALLFVVTTLAALAWNGLAIGSSYVARGTQGMGTGSVIAYYLKAPDEFFGALMRTLADPDTRRFYLHSFIGILGWLDTPLQSTVYALLGWGLFVLTVVGLRWRGAAERCELPVAIFLALLGSIAATGIFVALLVTWNPLSPQLIEGVQGRYFILPIVLLSYAIASSQALSAAGIRGRVIRAAVGLFLVCSILSTCNAIVQRYYLVSVPVAPKPSVFQGL